MFFHFDRLKLLSLALLTSGTVLGVHAQGDNSALPSDQAIIFSAPQNDASINTPSVAPQKPDQTELSTAPQPPLFKTPVQRFQMPSRQRLPQKSQEDRNNWTLMTPAEILGVETPEDVLKSPEQAAFDKERGGQNPMERFLKRQNQLQAGGTNGAQGANSKLQWDFSRNEVRPDSFGRGNGYTDNAQKKTADFLDSSIDEWSTKPNKNLGQNGFNTSSRSPSSATMMRQADSVARFQELLASASSPSSTILKPSSGVKNLPAVQPLVDPNLQPRPQVNPNGASFTPLSSGIVRPTAITPLPTLTSQNIAPSVTTPSWMPKPAPWLSTAPQPFAIPQRKF